MVGERMPKTLMVKSPAGDSIQIVPDAEWAEAVGESERSLRQWGGMKRTKALMIRALWEHGEFTEKSGRTSGLVLNYINEQYGETDIALHSIMHIWKKPMNYPAVSLNVRGKRTYSMKLVALPETWHRKLLADIAASPSSNGPQPTQEAPEAPQEASQMNGEAQVTNWSDADWEALQLDAPTIYEEPPPLEAHIAGQVAMSLLTTVVEIISAGTADTKQLSGSRQLASELEHAQGLLAQRLQENDKLRKQLREAGDNIVVLRHERDGLRSRLRATEHNLNEALKGETAAAVNAEIQKRVDQFMRVTPVAKGDD